MSEVAFTRDTILDARESTLNRLTADLSQRSGVRALLLAGTLGDGTGDTFSDVNLRVVVSDSEADAVLNQRSEIPKAWGNFLFHECIETRSTVSYFGYLVRIEVLYILQSEFRPAPWLSRGVRVLFDQDGLAAKTLEASKGLRFEGSSGEIAEALARTLGALIESAKRLKRGELIAASRLAIQASNHLMVLEDLRHSREPLGPRRFEARGASSLRNQVQSLKALGLHRFVVEYVQALTIELDLLFHSPELSPRVSQGLDGAYEVALRELKCFLGISSTSSSS